jgi:hypothetical protein
VTETAADWVAARTGVTPTLAPTTRLSVETVLQEASRPRLAEPDAGVAFTGRGQGAGRHLVDVHDHYRQEMAQVRAVLDEVRAGGQDVGAARGAVQQMALRANNWTLGGYCQAQCHSLTQHHTMESDGIFPHLVRSQPDLAPVLERLNAEHLVIHELLERVDRALVQLVAQPGDYGPISDALDLLTDTISSHFAYEESQLIAPLTRFGFFPGQL